MILPHCASTAIKLALRDPRRKWSMDHAEASRDPMQVPAERDKLGPEYHGATLSQRAILA